MNETEALKKLQAEELGILLEFDAYCKSHNIEYFLDGGTALGAKRHGGFIPWDDDIDVGLLRNQYDKFAQLIEQEPIPGLRYITARNTPQFGGMSAKLCREGTKFYNDETIDAGFDQGIFIDLFAFDQLAEDNRRRAAQLKNAALWQSASYIRCSKQVGVPHKGALGAIELTGRKALHHVLGAAMTPERIIARFERSYLQGNDELSGLRTCFTSGIKACVYPEESLVPATPIKFEGHELPGPAQIEPYLEIHYGDWKTLPAPENRHTHLPKLLQFSDGTVWEA